MTQPSTSPPSNASTLREACADLLRRLARGEPARAESYFESFPALAADAEAAVELIYTEFAAREEAGEQPQAEAFLVRFPQWVGPLRRQLDIHRLLNGDGEQATPKPAGLLGAAATKAGSAAADAPQEFGAYHVLRRLGRGGMGTVYLATHGALGRLAAVKVLHGSARGDQQSADPTERTSAERFRAEVRSVAALGHQGIVQLYELGETSDGRHFAAFEFVEGGSLQQALQGRPRPAREAAELVRRVAEALDVAHKAGIVHCDLTPANILLAPDGTPKIADFGLARLPRSAADLEAAAAPHGARNHSARNSAELDEEPQPDTAHLSSVALAGTPGYLAPERIDNPASAAPAADLYGLGAVFYELLTGRPPHIGATPLDTLRQTRDYDPPSPRTLAPSVPRDAATICLKCLERDPARRYATAAALADDLRRFLAGEPIAARPIHAVERLWKWAGRHRGLAAALATAAAALVALGIGGAWYNVRLREALDQSKSQETQIARQASDLETRVEQLDRSLFTMQLNQAEALLQRAPHQALALLNDVSRCPPERRDFAWGYLVRRASQDRRTFLGHTGPIGAVVCTQPVAGGPTLLITAGLDDTVRRWNLADDATVGTVPVVTSDAALVALNPDGSRLAAAYADGSARLWNLAAGSAPRELVGHAEEITALTFFNGGRWLATASADGRLRIWDPTGAAITSWQVAEAGEILSLAASPDDQTLVLGLTGGIVRFVDSIEGTTTAQEIGKGAGPTSLSFTADGKQLLGVDGATGRLELWNLGERRTSRLLDLPEGFARTAVIRRDGAYLAYATAEGLVRVVRPATGEVTAEYRGHLARITGLAFTVDGAGLVSVSEDRTAKYWDVPGVRYPQLIEGDEFKTFATAYSPSGRLLANAGADGVIRIQDLWPDAETSQTRKLVGHGAAVRVLRFFGEDQLLSGAEDNTVRFWDLKKGKEVRSWSQAAWVQDVAVAEHEIFSADAAGHVRRSDGFDFVAHAGSIHAVAAIRTRDRDPVRAKGEVVEPTYLLATSARDRTVKLWDGQGKFVATLVAPGQDIVSLAFAPDGKTLAGGDDAGNVTLWDVDTRAVRYTLRGHSRGVYALAFSPDGRILASASGGRWLQTSGEVKLWDVSSGQVHATLDGYTAPLAFRPDGLALAAGRDNERKIAIWTAAPYRVEMNSLSGPATNAPNAAKIKP
ncbi:MAG: hypothetical protein C0483_15405 [Pirellula sp.]|nr:hypothetical protein [Pirellula sp.]